MKKCLLFLFVIFCMLPLAGQSYKTVHCHDECKYVYYDTLYIYYHDPYDNNKLKKHVYQNHKMGLIRFDEILSVDSTNALGYIELEIPDMQETDIYNLIIFQEYIRYYGCGFGGRRNYLDTSYTSSENGWIAHHIMCKEHGRMKDSLLTHQAKMTDMSIDVFPIPATDMVSIRFSQSFTGKYSLLQMTGIPVQENTIYNTELMDIDVSKLSGTYLLVVYDLQGKLVKQEKLVVL